MVLKVEYALLWWLRLWDRWDYYQQHFLPEWDQKFKSLWQLWL